MSFNIPFFHFRTGFPVNYLSFHGSIAKLFTLTLYWDVIADLLGLIQRPNTWGKQWTNALDMFNFELVLSGGIKTSLTILRLKTPFYPLKLLLTSWKLTPKVFSCYRVRNELDFSFPFFFSITHRDFVNVLIIQWS